MTAKQKYHLYLEFAKLIEAGFGMVESARMLAGSATGAVERSFAGNLHERLEKGEKTPAALAAAGKGISRMEMSLVDAGERTGQLAETFSRLGEYFCLLAQAQKELISSLIYPVVLVHLLLLVVAIPFGERPMMGEIFGRWLLHLIIFYGICGGLYFCWCRVTAGGERRRKVYAAMNRVPLVGTLLRKVAFARFLNVYHSCVTAGIGMKETVSLAGDAAQHGSFEQPVAALQERLDEGKDLGPVFAREEIFPEAFRQSYGTAELTGTLDRDLQRWSRLQNEEARAAIRQVSLWVPKIAYAAVACFIGLKIANFYLSYFAQLESLM